MHTDLPVTVIGGYLGVGKTTLVNHLLRHAAPRRLAVLVNEFGELPIDADLIESQRGDVISLAGGCVCCSYGNDLISALMDVLNMQPRPDHVLLESSGVALPGAIAGSVSLLSGVCLDAVVVMADAETVQQRASDKYMADTVLRQLADADLLLLNKCDLPSAEELMRCQQWLAQQNPSARVLCCERAQVPLELLLAHPNARHRSLSGAPVGPHSNPFHSYTLAVPEPVEPLKYGRELVQKTAGLVRAKGFVRDLQGQLVTLQIVGARVAVSSAPDTLAAEVEPALVMISVSQG